MRTWALLICLALVPIGAADAQWSFDHAWNNCTNGQADPIKRISACNSLVQAEGLTRTETAFAYLDLAAAYYAQKDSENELTALNSAISLQPFLWQAYADRIPVLLHRGDREGAKSDFNVLTKIDPASIGRKMPNVLYGSGGVEKNDDPTDEEERRQYDLSVAKAKAQIDSVSAPDDTSHPK